MTSQQFKICIRQLKYHHHNIHTIVFLLLFLITIKHIQIPYPVTNSIHYHHKHSHDNAHLVDLPYVLVLTMNTILVIVHPLLLETVIIFVINSIILAIEIMQFRFYQFDILIVSKMPKPA